MIFKVFSCKNTVNRKNYIKICVINFTVSRQKNVFFYSVVNANFLVITAVIYVARYSIGLPGKSMKMITRFVKGTN